MSRLPFQVTCVAVLTSVCMANAAAEICLYRDADGHSTYSNVTESPPKGATRIRCFKDPNPPAAPAAQPPRAPQKPAASGPGSNAFPKVDGDTQRKRDDERRRILQQELSAEQQRLDQAQQALSEQESVRTGDERNYQRFLERVQPFRDAVENHQRNIEAIQRELANMR
jgi:hypothetical protein